MDTLTELALCVQDGLDEQATTCTQRAIEAGLSAKQILDEGLLEGMAVVGRRFKAREIFLPDVLMAAKAMQAGMALLEPLLVKEDVPMRGRIVIGTMQGDIHDIGKNLVGIMLRGVGIEVIDLGTNVTPERFVEEATKHDAPVIGMSALLTTTMQAMRNVVDLVNERGLADKIKTIIGGAPVSMEFAREIGADAYGYDASSAVERIKALIDEN